MKQVVLDRRKKSAIPRQRPPSEGDAETQEALDHVVARSIGVMGGEAEAFRWLRTPVRALNYATPVFMLETEAGKTLY